MVVLVPLFVLCRALQLGRRVSSVRFPLFVFRGVALVCLNFVVYAAFRGAAPGCLNFAFGFLCCVV